MIAGELERLAAGGGGGDKGLSSLGFSSTLDTVSLLRAVWRREKWRGQNQHQGQQYTTAPFTGASPPPPLGPAPPRFAQGVVYEHLMAREMEGAHSAVGDVSGLEEILNSPPVAPRWRAVAATEQKPLPPGL